MPHRRQIERLQQEQLLQQHVPLRDRRLLRHYDVSIRRSQRLPGHALVREQVRPRDQAPRLLLERSRQLLTDRPAVKGPPAPAANASSVRASCGWRSRSAACGGRPPGRKIAAAASDFASRVSYSASAPATPSETGNPFDANATAGANSRSSGTLP